MPAVGYQIVDNVDSVRLNSMQNTVFVQCRKLAQLIGLVYGIHDLKLAKWKYEENEVLNQDGRMFCQLQTNMPHFQNKQSAMSPRSESQEVFNFILVKSWGITS